MRGGRRRQGARVLTPEQAMVDAIRAMLGKRPLYAPERGDDCALRVAQDQIDAIKLMRWEP